MHIDVFRDMPKLNILHLNSQFFSGKGLKTRTSLGLCAYHNLASGYASVKYDSISCLNVRKTFVGQVQYYLKCQYFV